MKRWVHLSNGPKLDLLGSREPDIYGSAKLQDVDEENLPTGLHVLFATWREPTARTPTGERNALAPEGREFMRTLVLLLRRRDDEVR